MRDDPPEFRALIQTLVRGAGSGIQTCGEYADYIVASLKEQGFGIAPLNGPLFLPDVAPLTDDEVDKSR